MKEYNLLEDMRYWRPERPDEWKMDEFIRGVEKLSQELQEQQKEIDELRAHVERLRDEIFHAACELAESDINDDDGLKALHASLVKASSETPVQSLNHIMAQVEEETIERCAKQALAVNARILGKQIKCLPRKYSNQPETVAKDGE